MICGTFAKAGLNSDQADQAEQDFNNTDPPPTRVLRTQAQDGSFTVTAEFPPCPANVTHDPGDAAAAAAAADAGAPPAGTATNAAAAAAATLAGSTRGRFAIDSLDPASQATLDAATAAGGAAPAFWGRYFYAPGQVNSSGHTDAGMYSAKENALLRSNGIRVLPICRQTGNVGLRAADGAADAARNLDALFEVFPVAYLSGADPDVLVFLDCETSPTQPTLSADYYTGWGSTIVSRSASLSAGRVRVHPALYASRSDTGAFANLRSAIAAGAPCDGVWIAAWNTTPGMVDWNDRRVTPSGGLPCPILAWQYFSKAGVNFDSDTTNPAHDDVLMARLVMPPSAAMV